MKVTLLLHGMPADM